ncbi:DUF1697 domain-containing protein [Luedemannella helvata]|uniref:DUF1697 domain-containing protein n=2 Tax=Luedemannella helvata TaxID=349315 RepID=A0ABP4VU23_9ACTN
MAKWRTSLEALGFTGVATYINSGNVLLDSTDSAATVKKRIDADLAENFAIHDEKVKVLVLTRGQLKKVIENRPTGFGDEPKKYHSDAIFLMGVSTSDAMAVFNPREGVDTIWPGDGVIYSRRLSAERTKSRLSAIMSSPLYTSMTIRSWSTTMKLWDLMND